VTTRRLVFLLTVILLGAAMTAPAAAQAIAPVAPLVSAADLDRVRTLYGSAAYEEALAAMPSVNGEAVRTDLEQYRALCLLALGREQEAVATVERLVRDNPMYLPAAGDTTPRLQAIFAAARSKLVPDLAKAAYGDGKAAYESKNRDVAHGAFKRTIELIDSLPNAGKTSLADLRLLAGEFLTLSVPPPAPVSPPAPPAPAAPDKAKPAASGEFAGPIAVREQLPLWKPPDTAARRTEYLGLLRIQIDAEGRVTSAAIVKGSHPAFDVAAVTAAKSWLYKPATRGGLPVASSKEIQVRLVPQ
jgi:TonB family protein